VQGVLRKEKLDFEIRTQCAQSDRSMNIIIDSDLKVKKIDIGSNPYIFTPSVDTGNLREPSIIEVF
jgi:hypothetical protein